MSVSTYSELRSAIGDWLNRDDLTAVIPTFIDLAEAQINRDVRHYDMEQRATATITGRFLDRPDDWVETLRISVESNGQKDLTFASKATIASKRAGSEDATGIPQFYCHTDGGFEVYPTPDGSYQVTVLYYKSIPALSDENTSNWLLVSHPDVYLYGSLIHTAGYLADDARLATWAQLYSAAVSRVNQTSDDASWSGTGLKLKVSGLG